MYLEIIPEDILLIIVSKLPHTEFDIIINLLNIKPDNGQFFKKLVILKFNIIPKYNYNWYLIYTDYISTISEDTIINIFKEGINDHTSLELDQFLYKEKLYTLDKVYKYILPELAELSDYNSVNEILDYLIGKYKNMEFESDFENNKLEIYNSFESLLSIILNANMDIFKKIEIMDKIVKYTYGNSDYHDRFAEYLRKLKSSNGDYLEMIDKISSYGFIEKEDLPIYIYDSAILKRLIERMDIIYNLEAIVSYFRRDPELFFLEYIFDNYSLDEIEYLKYEVFAGIIKYIKTKQIRETYGFNKDTHEIQSILDLYSRLSKNDE
jgi:hypothetical protein